MFVYYIVYLLIHVISKMQTYRELTPKKHYLKMLDIVYL